MAGSDLFTGTLDILILKALTWGPRHGYAIGRWIRETTEDVLAFYGRARAAADQAIDELDIEDTGTAWFGEAVTMRWVLIHMVEETARHAGHVDILRELIDEMAGDHRPG